jgi:uncharacterized membrane protein YecN with MAPEG domain
MPPLPVTATTAALLGVVFVVLTARVIDGGGAVIPSGQESTVPLLVATRSHANFAEFVPFTLILLGFVEATAAARWFVCLLATMLLIGRVLHPFGMGRKIPNPFRAAGAVLTVLTIAIGSLYLLAEVARG